MEDNKKRLVAAFLQFIADEQNSDSLTADAKESLEVATQCLEAAYSVSSVDAAAIPKSLLDIFTEGVPKLVPQQSAPISDEVKQRAEQLKNEGNEDMKADRFPEAIDKYSQAIELDGNNAVYYCNRAAAYSKTEEHEKAIEDCKKALQIDSRYSKAYGRMGLAFASTNNHYKARDCYRRALELDPNNESYQNNLRIAEEKLADMERRTTQGLGAGMPFGGGMPGFDLGSILNNPALVNMATQIMQDPNMQNLMGNLMGGLGVPPPTGTPPPPPSADGTATSTTPGGDQSSSTGSQPSSQTTPPPPPPPTNPNPAGMPNLGGGMDAFLRAGQQLAAQMQAANPDLVETLRHQMQERQDGEGEDGSEGGGPAGHYS